jgi:hypothetical protein
VGLTVNAGFTSHSSRLLADTGKPPPGRFSDRTSQRFVFLPELKRGAIPRIVCGASGFVFACWYRKNRRTLLRGMLQLFW